MCFLPQMFGLPCSQLLSLRQLQLKRKGKIQREERCGRLMIFIFCTEDMMKMFLLFTCKANNKIVSVCLRMNVNDFVSYFFTLQFKSYRFSSTLLFQNFYIFLFRLTHHIFAHCFRNKSSAYYIPFHVHFLLLTMNYITHVDIVFKIVYHLRASICNVYRIFLLLVLYEKICSVIC